MTTQVLYVRVNKILKDKIDRFAKSNGYTLTRATEELLGVAFDVMDPTSRTVGQRLTRIEQAITKLEGKL